MLKVSGDAEERDHGEDVKMIYNFIEFIKSRVDYKVIVVMATQWESYDDIKQANLAIQIAGEVHASRFMMLLDYMANKFKKGELK